VSKSANNSNAADAEAVSSSGKDEIIRGLNEDLLKLVVHTDVVYLHS
jgi:hypothetical protein